MHFKAASVMNICTLILFIAHGLERSLELKQITYFKHVVGIWPKARLKKKKDIVACKRKKKLNCYYWYAHGADTWINEYSKLIGGN